MVVKNVLPGYYLKIAVKDHQDWPKGWYGLVQCNDPDFVWKGKPKLDPTFHMSDKEQEALPDDSPIWNDVNKFFKFIESIEPNFECDPIMGYQLVEACKKAGYDEKKHGLRVIAWLSHHMAEKIKKRGRK
jgi:hypothetical protein